MHKSMAWLYLGFLSVGCMGADSDPPVTPDPPVTAEPRPEQPGCPSSCGVELEALATRAPRLVQAGVDQLLLAVTSDDYAVYQEGQTLYAAKLRPGAARTVIGTVPGTNIAFPLQVGKEVFIWTTPQRQLPGFGVSPLLLWTADNGAQLISAQSAVGLVATAASDDDKQILFTTNASDDGLRGDVVTARTRDALATTTLLTDIPLDFPGGQCRPVAGFGGHGGEQFPVAEYCAGTDTTGTLSTWEHGRKRDLIANLQTPLLFTLENDPQGTTYLVNLADSHIATVTTGGKVTIVDDVAEALAGRQFLNRRGTAVYSAQGSAGVELRLARHGRAPETISPLAVLYAGRYNRNGYYKDRTSSPDGSLALYGTAVDPNTGLTDLNLLDVDTGRTIGLETGLIAQPTTEIFTSDSRFGIFIDLLDVNVGVGSLFAGGRHGSHQIGTSLQVWDSLRAEDSNISYNETPTFVARRNFMLSTADLFVADASDPHATPRLVSLQANLFYLPSVDRKSVIFYSATEAEGPGLYVASARP